jgi:phosphate transport system protein
MTRIRFQQSLEDLKENLLVMAGLAEQAIQRAIEAYRTRDLSICDLVSRSEIAINRMERDIDQTALDLLAMEQPMAIDLRFILSVIKINADLERVGDAAKSIAERVRHMERLGSVELPVDIPRMASLAADMVRRSLQSFIEGDAELARTVLTMDDAVDQMNRSSYKTLTRVMEESSHLAPQALNALMISRSLERVADHATNIAEDVIFWVQGDDVRHPKSVAKAGVSGAVAAPASSGAAPAGAAASPASTSAAPADPAPAGAAPVQS